MFLTLLVISPIVSDARAKAFDAYDDDLLARLRMQRKLHVQEGAAPAP